MVVTDSSIALIVRDFYSSMNIGSTLSRRVPLPKTSLLVSEAGAPAANCTLRNILIIATASSQNRIPTMSPYGSNIPTLLNSNEPSKASRSQVPNFSPTRFGLVYS